MMSYLHEMAEMLVRRLHLWGEQVIAFQPGEGQGEDMPVAVAMEMQGWSQRLERVVELARPELLCPPPAELPGAGLVGANGTARPSQTAPPPAEVNGAQLGNNDVETGPVLGIPLKEALAASPGQSTFVIPSAALSVHLERISGDRVLLEMAICNQRLSPLVVWWPSLGMGETYYCQVSRVDVDVSWARSTEQGNTGG